MKVTYHDIEQNTPEWFALRLGIPTASRFGDVISKGRGSAPSKTRRTYALQLLAERMTGELRQNFTNEHTVRGHEHEPIARDAYEFQTGNDVQQIGFVSNDTHIAGFSPDGLVGDHGIIEIKSKLPHLHLDILLRGNCGVPPEYMAQIQGGMLVSDRSWCDFVSYCPDLPLVVIKVFRDEEYIKRIEDGLIGFNVEIGELREQVEAYEAMV